MKVNFKEGIFACTETLQNGKERTIKKSVFFPCFLECKNVTKEFIIEHGTQALEAEHYYNIRYVGTVLKSVVLPDGIGFEPLKRHGSIGSFM